MRPVGILVHSTGANNPWMKRYVDAPDVLGVNPNNNHWNKASATKCMHAFVGKDITGSVAVAHTLPYTVASWGCGKGINGSYNRDPTGHIQFEICEDGLKNEAYYREAFEVAEEYCVYLCQQFGIPASAIVGHYEAAQRGYASNHADPRHWMNRFGDSMDAFRARVAARLGGQMPEYVEVTKVLQIGSSGVEVAGVQHALIELGHDLGRFGPNKNGADGKFGAMTEKAVKEFQEANSMTVTGTWGVDEQKRLDEIMSQPPAEDPGVDPPDNTLIISLPHSAAQALFDALKAVL